MAENIARQKQYEYKANSNLVLQSTERRDRSHEATVEPESLWGKITYKFGDLARSAAPTTDKVEKMRKRAATNNQTGSAVAPRAQTSSKTAVV